MHAKRDSEGGGRIVIVAEGDGKRAALIAAALGGAHAAETWPSIAHAAELLGRGQPAELLLLGLSGISPEPACAALKAVAPDLPLLVLYFDPPPYAWLRAREAGADDSAGWPVEPGELRLRVQTLLDRSARWSQCQREIADLRRLAGFKDDLVSLIVHDLRNPLAGMLGYLSALEGATQGSHPDLREDVQGALGSARKLEEVLGELLQIRMLEEAALRPRLQRTPLRELLESAGRSLAGASREHGVSIAVDASPADAALIDAKLVRRAIENLIANALRYSPRGATVTAGARLVDGAVCFEIADAGPGIPDQFKEAIFGKFTSVEEERGQTRLGFGLGLYQVKLVVDAHGGRVLVRDRPGGGAVFEMRLPTR